MRTEPPTHLKDVTETRPNRQETGYGENAKLKAICESAPKPPWSGSRSLTLRSFDLEIAGPDILLPSRRSVIRACHTFRFSQRHRHRRGRPSPARLRPSPGVWLRTRGRGGHCRSADPPGRRKRAIPPRLTLPRRARPPRGSSFPHRPSPRVFGAYRPASAPARASRGAASRFDSRGSRTRHGCACQDCA